MESINNILQPDFVTIEEAVEAFNMPISQLVQLIDEGIISFPYLNTADKTPVANVDQLKAQLADAGYLSL